jgi:hypothetical protein
MPPSSSVFSQYLPAADVVVIMDEGSILDMGTYEQLLARGVDLSSIVDNAEDEDNVTSDTSPHVTGEALLLLTGSQKVVLEEDSVGFLQEETAKRGSVSEVSSAEEEFKTAIKIMALQQPLSSPLGVATHNSVSGQEHGDAGQKHGNDEEQKLLLAAEREALPKNREEDKDKKASLRGGATEAERERLMKTLDMKEKDGKVTKV